MVEIIDEHKENMRELRMPQYVATASVGGFGT
jgi:hypothetical protein